MFVDASALVAIIANEPERRKFRKALDSSVVILVSPVVLYETTTAIMRLGQLPMTAANGLVRHLLESSKAATVPIDPEVGELALEAFERYGRGHHKAALNMGDCFAYACAKAHKVPLLFKGGDFSLTDIAVA